jgi:hypothetical protein
LCRYATAHLRAVVLYIVDASEQCGYTIKQQVGLVVHSTPGSCQTGYMDCTGRCHSTPPGVRLVVWIGCMDWLYGLVVWIGCMDWLYGLVVWTWLSSVEPCFDAQ